MRILVADDEPDMTMVLEALLKREHYSVDVVHNGQDALDYGLTGNYTCIVLDIMMPKLDGIQALQTPKNVATPVLLLTAKSQVEDRVTGLDSEAEINVVWAYIFSVKVFLRGTGFPVPLRFISGTQKIRCFR